jgi:hypothetical protein
LVDAFNVRVAVTFFLFLSSLFFCNAFNNFWGFALPATQLEFLRGSGFWSVYIDWAVYVFDKVPVITWPGMAALLLWTTASYHICRERGYSLFNIVVAMVLNLLIYELLMHDFRFFDFKNTLFKSLSLHWLFAANVLLSLLAGATFLVLVKNLRYFKYVDKGEVSP